MSHSAKLKFRWTGPYRVREVIEEKGTYFLEELDGTPIKKHFHGNRVKKFWARDELMYVPIQEGDEGNDEAGCLNQEEQQDNENEARWIPPGQDFAVVI